MEIAFGIGLGILVAIIIFVIIFKIKKHKKEQKIKEKGFDGEYEIQNIIGEDIEGKQYSIHNLLFETAKNNTCQIDHIVINENGIWVIETKNYSGKILGSENQQNWTQVSSYGNEKRQFYNPIKQNQAHIYHLSEYLKTKNIFHNIVVFLPKADISNVNAQGVYLSNQLNQVISQNTIVKLNTRKIKEYYTKLLSLQNSSNVTLEEHINNIEAAQYNIDHNRCPLCGGKLVLRKNQYSRFYGCKNYPKCKFTKKL